MSFFPAVPTKGSPRRSSLFPGASPTKIISEKASKRIANYAFTIAKKRENPRQRKVTCVHKSNVMKKTDGLFARTCSKVANDFSENFCTPKGILRVTNLAHFMTN